MAMKPGVSGDKPEELAVREGSAAEPESHAAPVEGGEGAAGDDAAPTLSSPSTSSGDAEAAPQTSPAWTVPLYLGGLVLLYLGERVFSEVDNGRWFASGLGLAAVGISTFVRFAPRFRSGGARKEIENTLAQLSLVGLLGVVLYFSTTDEGIRLLGLDKMEAQVRERITAIIRVVWVSLVWLTLVPMIFAELALYPMRHAERPESRRVRAAATSGLVLSLAAVYAVLFVFSADAADIKADFSYFKTSRPSEATVKLAKQLDAPVRVVAFFPQVNQVKSEVQSYLTELAASTPKLKVEFKDRLLSPQEAQKLLATKDGDIVLTKGGDEREKLSVLSADIEEASTRDALRKFDQSFQEHLLKMVRKRRIVYLTVGHGEINDGDRAAGLGKGSQAVRALLEAQNYHVSDLGIPQGLGREIPLEADVVLVLGPAEPFAPEEIQSLQRYVERGGKLLIALDPDRVAERSFDLVQGGSEGVAPAQPETGAAKARAILEPLAKIAGLEIDTAVLANPKQHLAARFNKSDRVLMYTSSFSSHASVSTLSRNAPRAAVVVGGTASFERAKDAKGEVNFTVRSMAGTFADENSNYEKDESEKAQVFNLAAAIAREVPKAASAGAQNDAASEASKEGEKAKGEQGQATKKDEKKAERNEARIFVSGDADVFTDTFLGRFNANQAFFYDAVRWLGGEESFAGSQSTEEDVRIQHSRQEDTVVFYSVIFGAPALVLGLGLFASRRSRRRLSPVSTQGSAP